MSNLISAVFENQEKAYEGAYALRGLEREGSLDIRGAAIVARDDDGSLRVRAADDKGPISTALGMLTGGIIGAFGGPAGVVTGTAVGGLLGAGVETYNLSVGDVFVDQVAAELEPGRVALVAEVDESWTTPLDTRMGELGVDVVRRSRDLFEDEQWERDAAAARAEYQRLKEELATTHADNKAAVQAKLDRARDRLTAASQKAEARHRQAMQEGEAKVAELVEQARNANDEKRAEIEARIADVLERNAQRREKLGAAAGLTREALIA